MPEISAAEPQAPRWSIWVLLKWLLCLVVVAFVGRYAWNLWKQEAFQNISWSTLHYGWLALASVTYTLAWLPSIWFWRALMKRAGMRMPWPQVVRAYFCGHLGKYIPGKASALVIRGAMMKQAGGRTGPAILMSAYDTLYLMGVGLVIAVAWSPLLLSTEQKAILPSWFQSLLHPAWLPLVLATVVCLAGLPVLSWLLSQVAGKMTPREESGKAVVKIPPGLLAVGFFAYCGSWILQGITLGLIILAVEPAAFAWTDLPVWTGAACLATSVGFLMLFSPGGLGIREGLLIGTLSHQPEISPAVAVLAAMLMRLVSLSSEVLVSAVLYYGIPAAPDAPAKTDVRAEGHSE